MKDINIGQTVQYSSYHIAKELFFGLLIDESIDITTYKNLIVCAHIWKFQHTLLVIITEEGTYSEVKKLQVCTNTSLATDGSLKSRY